MKRHEVQVLKKAGHTNRQISEETGISERTVRRIAEEASVEAASDGALTRHRCVGRPSKVEAYRGKVREILKEEPDLPTVEILHRVRQQGYDGGKSALYRAVAELRPRTAAPMVRFEGLAGEFSQHDFGKVRVTYSGTGGSESIVFFASRLKYSRWVEVHLVSDERVESLVRALLSSFEGFGGVPLVCVFDNPKTVILRHRGPKIEWNRTFGQVALDYRFAPELCYPRRANQKGSVENLVGWVKNSFFKVRRFHDRADLEDQLAAWHQEVNHERPSRATGVLPAERMVTERERLRPLAIPPAEYPLRFPVMVGPTGRVVHNQIPYSLPPECIGFSGTLFLYPDQVRIVAGKYEAAHPRFPEVGQGLFSAEHRSAHLAKIAGQRAKLYFKRQQFLDLGPDAETLLTEIVHRHPRTWKGEVEILFDLLQQFGEKRLAKALALAVARRLFGSHFIARLLAEEVA